MNRSVADVEEFLATVDESDGMRVLDALIAAELTGLERVLWDGVMWGGTDQRIIGYGAIEQPRPKSPAVSWFLIGLARQKDHFSMYVNAPVERDPARLGKVKVGPAAITFRKIDDVDLDALRRVVREARTATPDVR